MGKVVTVSVVSKIGYELVDVPRVGLERPARREMYIANDLVDADAARNIAAFVGLLLQLV
jgi:hypothetical protein